MLLEVEWRDGGTTGSSAACSRVRRAQAPSERGCHPERAGRTAFTSLGTSCVVRMPNKSVTGNVSYLRPHETVLPRFHWGSGFKQAPGVHVAMQENFYAPVPTEVAPSQRGRPVLWTSFPPACSENTVSEPPFNRQKLKLSEGFCFAVPVGSTAQLPHQPHAPLDAAE